MTDITRVLSQIEEGDPAAAEQLLPLVYAELRRLASARMRRERPGHTLQPTALVHEAYLRLVDHSQPPRWDSRGHFFAAAAQAMRRILVENARRKEALRHGGQQCRLELDPDQLVPPASDEKLILLDEALTRLAAQDHRKAELVTLRFFAGLTNREVAHLLGISTATADRDWAYARAWLQRQITATE